MSDVPSGDAPTHGHGRVARIAVAVTATLSLLIGVGSAYGFVAYKQAGGDGPTIPTSDRVGSVPKCERALGPCVEDVCNYLLLGQRFAGRIERGGTRSVRDRPADRR